MKLGVLMDPIDGINIKKDSTFAMLLEAQSRGIEIHYMTQDDLFVENHSPKALTRLIEVAEIKNNHYKILSSSIIDLDFLDVILMRKDPPFDMEFIMDTYIMEMAEQKGTLVVNKPQALRDANEKFFTEYFPGITPDCCISRNPETLKQFANQNQDIIIKPMDGMGGNSIFKTHKNDPNLNVILETVTKNGTRTTMVQSYIAEINKGDKRILLVNGEPVPYCLARIPSDSDFRGNLAKGGTGVGQPLTEQDRKICEVVGPELRKRNILFAGIDVIGDKLTEVNVTSPTCIRELDEQFGLNIAGTLFDEIESKIK